MKCPKEAEAGILKLSNWLLQLSIGALAVVTLGSVLAGAQPCSAGRGSAFEWPFLACKGGLRPSWHAVADGAKRQGAGLAAGDGPSGAAACPACCVSRQRQRREQIPTVDIETGSTFTLLHGSVISNLAAILAKHPCNRQA